MPVPDWIQIGAEVVEVVEPTAGLLRLREPTRIFKIERDPTMRAPDLITTEDLRTYTIHDDQTVYARAIGRYGGAELLPVHHDLVLAIRAREHLTALANMANNLAHHNPRKPEDVVAYLAQLSRAVADSHEAVRLMLAERPRS